MSMAFSRQLRIAALVMLPVVALGACGGNKVQGDTSVAVASGPNGVIAVETFTSTATVTAINTKDRKVTLTFPDGKKTTFKASADMANFGQLNVGDQVNATVTEQAVIALTKNGGPPNAAAVGGAVLSPIGAKPGGVAVATYEVTATVVAVDASKSKVTLQFADGKPQKLKVGSGVNLSKVQVGDQIVAVVTEGVALTVTK
jgi:hypothetical protein